jgi:hypothetical protein
MVDKFGSDQQQLANSGGSVISQDGAVLVNGDSDGSDSLLFGPAALREIQAGIANGDFAIPPINSESTITADNSLPYWTFTDVNSAGAITCAVVADSGSGSGNVLRWSIANGTTTGKSARISRYIPIPSSRDRALSVFPTAYISEALGTNAQFKITYGFFTQDLTATGSAASATRTTVGSLSPSLSVINNAPADAAFVLLYITAETTGTTAALTGDLAEVRLGNYFSTLLVPESSDPATYVAGLISQSSGNLRLSGNNGSGAVLLTGNADVGGDLTINGTTTLLGDNSFWVARAGVASATQSLVNNTSTKILLDTASATPTLGTYDPQSWFVNASDHIAVGHDGFYVITANIAFAANATGRRTLTIAVNGADVGSVNVLAAPAASTILSVSTSVYLAGGDLVTMFALQQSGGALSTVVVAGVYPALSVGRIGA